MGYCISVEDMNQVLAEWSKENEIYAPKLFPGSGTFSETDIIRYGKIKEIGEIVFDQKSNYSFKEVLLPLSQTLFYFTEDEVKESNPPKKGGVIFLRSCDLHAVKRLDEVYLKNGYQDYYYKRLRDNVKFILIGCSKSFDHCFCVDMKTNRSDNYDAYIEVKEDKIYIDNHNALWDKLFSSYSAEDVHVEPSYVKETKTKVNIPENLSLDVAKSTMWKEYNTRCINCGRCNFVCPTCTCFTMQDIFYRDNGKVGERRRVQASCMVDGFTDVADGGSYRKENGERMRFKVLHKVYDFKKRNGYHMCVGCGRCEDICPQYISFSNCINKLEDAMKEVSNHE